MCLLNGDIGGNIPSSVDFGMIDLIKDVYSSIEFEDFSKYEANKYYIYDLNSGEYVISTDDYDSTAVYYTKDSIIEQKKLTIKEIILQAVHTYGKEAYQNIIVNDLDDCGLELLQYRGDKDLYLLYDENALIYDQMTFQTNYELGVLIKPKPSEENKDKIYTIGDLQPGVFNTGIDSFNEDRWQFQNIVEDGKTVVHSVTKISNNSSTDEGLTYDSSAIGYRVTELIYAGDLVCSIGESLTSVLDKIKNMLGAFEYFYDINGKFIFQAKKIYANSSWNSLIQTDGNIFARDMIEDSPYSYSFENVNLIQKFTNTPSINNVKNDYSIWGTRKSVSGAEIPIHARYAIDKKPIAYTSISVSTKEATDLMNKFPDLYKKLSAVEQTSKRYVIKKENDNDIECDWREIIYQMALDYYKYNQWANFSNKIVEANKKDNLYMSGSTGYEQYYIDLQGFWRQLYNPDAENEVIFDTEGGLYEQEKFYLVNIPTDGDGEKTAAEIFDNNKIHYFIPDENRKLYSSAEKEEYKADQEYYTNVSGNNNLYASELYRMGYRWDEFKQLETFSCDYYLKPPSNVDINDLDLTIYSTDKYYWNKNVVQAPALLNFWFDFYEGDDILQQYQVSSIGDRPKVVNDSKITSVYYSEVPQVIFVRPDETQTLDIDQRKSGYTYLFLAEEYADYFEISSRGKSAEDEMTELFNKHSYCTENISITTIPIYHLEPNTLIHLKSDENHINGKYQISKLTIPLSYNGMMTISATKIVDAVY